MIFSLAKEIKVEIIFPYKATLCKRMGDLDPNFSITDLWGYNDDDNIGDMVMINLGDTVWIHAHFNSTNEIPRLSDTHSMFKNFLNNNAPIVAFAIEGVTKVWFTSIHLFEIGRHKCVCDKWLVLNVGCKCGGE